MKNIYIALAYLFFLIFNTITCTKNSVSKESKNISFSLNRESDCKKILYQLFYTSDFEKNEKYEIRVDEIRNDTIIIKAFTRNNLSDNPKTQQIVESVVGWFIIPPKRDALYLSLNALDPIEPNFKKIKTKEIFFKKFLNCNNQNKSNDMKDKIEFSDLFNEGTTIEFTPNDLNKNTEEIKEFKRKLEIYEQEHPLIGDFEIENLKSLINNETFTNNERYIDSSWLNYFINKYKINFNSLYDLMNLAIDQEDYNAVKIIVNNGCIVSKNQIKDAELSLKYYESLNGKIDTDEFYDPSFSQISKIYSYIKSSFLKNHIEDKDGYTNLRKEKSSSSEILQKIKSGEQIEVLDKTGDWFLVKTKEGKTGYVHKSRIVK